MARALFLPGTRLLSRFFLCFAFTFGFRVFTAGLERGATGFPAPENVADAGAPKTPGCGETAVRHESAVVHAGGEATTFEHGTPSLPHTCAS
jgi:hypothetical protein